MRLRAINNAVERPHGAVFGKKHNKAKAAAKALAACRLGIAPESATETSCRTASGGKTAHGRMRANKGFNTRAPSRSAAVIASAKDKRGRHASIRSRQISQQQTTPRQNTAIQTEDKATQNNSRGRQPKWLMAKKISSSRGRR
jgi:hypothetical protein